MKQWTELNIIKCGQERTKMRINSIIFDDTANAPGYSTSVYLQGCPHHCVGCFNPETWDPDGGRDFTYQDIEDILNSLYKNGIKRNLCILGGEPLASYNLFLTNMIITEVKNKYPDVPVIVGGIYASLMPQHCKEYTGCEDVIFGTIDEAEKLIPAYDLVDVNYQILHTTRGCIRKCGFCGTYIIEPEWKCKKSIKDEVIKKRLIFYDNNLLNLLLF